MIVKGRAALETTLTPECAWLQEMIYRPSVPRFYDLSVAEARLANDKLNFVLRPTMKDVTVVPLEISRPQHSPVATALLAQLNITDQHAEGSLSARLYRPNGASAGSLIVYLHGGGWCVGSVAAYDVLAADLAVRCGVAVLSLDYRLAPEHPFPAALIDVCDLYASLRSLANELGWPLERIAFAGDSAGGNLAAVVAMALGQLSAIELAAMPQLVANLLIYPATRLALNSPSQQLFATGYLLDARTQQWFYDNYLLLPALANDWRVSPLLASIDYYAKMPPSCLIHAGCDPLLSDNQQFAQLAETAGVSVEEHVFPGLLHGFLLWGGKIPQANVALACASEFLNRYLR